MWMAIWESQSLLVPPNQINPKARVSWRKRPGTAPSYRCLKIEGKGNTQTFWYCKTMGPNEHIFLAHISHWSTIQSRGLLQVNSVRGPRWPHRCTLQVLPPHFKITDMRQLGVVVGSMPGMRTTQVLVLKSHDPPGAALGDPSTAEDGSSRIIWGSWAEIGSWLAKNYWWGPQNCTSFGGLTCLHLKRFKHLKNL